jgi:hypothetical protein
MNVYQFCERYGITADSTWVGASDWDRHGSKWKVKLMRPVSKYENARGKKSTTVEFQTGSAIQFGNDPEEDARLVLSALQSDAQTAENSGSAEDIASEFGYDWYAPAGRKEATRVFRGVNKVKDKLERFLGDLYDEFVWNTAPENEESDEDEEEEW